MFFQPGGVDICGECFRFVQGFLVTDIQFIDQYRGDGITFRGNRVKAVPILHRLSRRTGKDLADELVYSYFAANQTLAVLLGLSGDLEALHARRGMASRRAAYFFRSW